MENEDKTGFLIIGAIVIAVIAYSIGISNGKDQAIEEYAQEYSDNDYLSMKACYESVLNDKNEVDSITSYMGYGDTYEDLTSAISSIKSVVSGKTAGVPKIPGDRKSGYYDCE